MQIGAGVGGGVGGAGVGGGVGGIGVGGEASMYVLHESEAMH
jgi:hypothetical protein